MRLLDPSYMPRKLGFPQAVSSFVAVVSGDFGVDGGRGEMMKRLSDPDDCDRDGCERGRRRCCCHRRGQDDRSSPYLLVPIEGAGGERLVRENLRTRG